MVSNKEIALKAKRANQRIVAYNNKLTDEERAYSVIEIFMSSKVSDKFKGYSKSGNIKFTTSIATLTDSEKAELNNLLDTFLGMQSTNVVHIKAEHKKNKEAKRQPQPKKPLTNNKTNNKTDDKKKKQQKRMDNMQRIYEIAKLRQVSPSEVFKMIDDLMANEDLTFEEAVAKLDKESYELYIKMSENANFMTEEDFKEEIKKPSKRQMWDMW